MPAAQHFAGSRQAAMLEGQYLDWHSAPCWRPLARSCALLCPTLCVLLYQKVQAYKPTTRHSMHTETLENCLNPQSGRRQTKTAAPNSHQTQNLELFHKVEAETEDECITLTLCNASACCGCKGRATQPKSTTESPGAAALSS